MMQHSGHAQRQIKGTDGDDVLNTTPVDADLMATGEAVIGGDGDDVLNLTAFEAGNTTQIHAYGEGGDDRLTLDFGPVEEFAVGHHVYGDYVTKGEKGRDVFNFTNIARVDGVVVGRLDDFDPKSDRIQIEGVDLDLRNLPSGVRVVEYNGNHNDLGAEPQQWLLIDTGEGHIFYALDGARVDMTGDGGADGGDTEAHFIKREADFDAIFADLKDVPYRDPENHVEVGRTTADGLVINDIDRDIADVRAVVSGTEGRDLIAAGLNDDTVDAGSGNDRVLGGDGNDVLRGRAGNDVLRGGDGNDVLLGGDGDDVLDGNVGSDRLTGGAGADKFAYFINSGADVILDFTSGDDVIDLVATGVASLDELRPYMSSSADGTVIDFGRGDVLTLDGIDMGSLTASDFAFADGGKAPPAPPAPQDQPVPVAEPTPAPSDFVRNFTFDADAGRRTVLDDYDVDRTGSERSYDTVEIAFGGERILLRDIDDLLDLMRDLEGDGTQNADTEVVVTPDDDLELRFSDDSALVLDGAADEFSAAQLVSVLGETDMWM